MKHTIIFTREGEPDTNLLLEFWSSQPDTAAAFRLLHAAIHRWITNSSIGSLLLKESGSDLNIGDLACNLDKIRSDAEFAVTCEAFGVGLENVRSVDLRVPYDRRLCQPPKEG